MVAVLKTQTFGLKVLEQPQLLKNFYYGCIMFRQHANHLRKK